MQFLRAHRDMLCMCEIQWGPKVWDYYLVIKRRFWHFFIDLWFHLICTKGWLFFISNLFFWSICSYACALKTSLYNQVSTMGSGCHKQILQQILDQLQNLSLNQQSAQPVVASPEEQSSFKNPINRHQTEPHLPASEWYDGKPVLTGYACPCIQFYNLSICIDNNLWEWWRVH